MPLRTINLVCHCAHQSRSTHTRSSFDKYNYMMSEMLQTRYRMKSVSDRDFFYGAITLVRNDIYEIISLGRSDHLPFIFMILVGAFKA